MKRLRWAQSLQVRLLVVTMVALSAALVLAGGLLTSLFRQQVERQFEDTLRLQLDQLTASMEFGAEGPPWPRAQALSDPRWERPYSGLYWQMDGPVKPAVLRSRSLWDTALSLPADTLGNGAVHVHHGIGPLGAGVLMLERTVHPAGQPERSWRLVVAADTQALEAAVQRFDGRLSASLGLLLVLLALAALAQVHVGLRPLRRLQAAVTDLRDGRAARLQGEFPSEMASLVDDFNGVLDRHADVVARARQQAGNLAHAIKTPLAVLAQAATQHKDEALAQLLREQVPLANRHIDWHLARARASGVQRLPGQRTALAPVLGGLLRVMQRVHAARGLAMQSAPAASDASASAPLLFAGEEQDLHEILGNLLDNACKWARHTVRVQHSLIPATAAGGPQLCVAVDDDGPGIEDSLRHQVLARGQRADESVPGSGLGLAIVTDLVTLYGGSLALSRSPLGGLSAVVRLPAVV
jgi:signal transduction histidine kinase